MWKTTMWLAAGLAMSGAVAAGAASLDVKSEEISSQVNSSDALVQQQVPENINIPEDTVALHVKKLVEKCLAQKESGEQRISTGVEVEVAQLKGECESVEVKQEKSEKEIRDILSHIGLSEDVLVDLPFLPEDKVELKNEYRIIPFNDSLLANQNQIDKDSIFGEDITNLSDEQFREWIENIAKTMWEMPHNMQYSSNAWIERLKEVAPNWDELEMVQRYIDGLSQQIDPKIAWSGLAALFGLDRPTGKDIPTTAGEFEKVYRWASVYAIHRALKPQNIENSYILMLPEDQFGADRWYPIVSHDIENISLVNAYLNNKIPQEQVDGYQELWKKGLIAFNEWYKQELEEKFKDPKRYERVVNWKFGWDEEKAMSYFLERGEKSYTKTMDMIYEYTENETFTWVNALQRRAPKYIKTWWEDVSWGFEITRNWVLIDEQIVFLEAEWERLNSKLETLNVEWVLLQKELRAGIAILRKLWEYEKADNYEKQFFPTDSKIEVAQR